MKYPQEMADKLNTLLEKTYDSEKGFRNAADDVNDPKLKSYFMEIAQQRYDFGHELKTEIRNFGEAPDKGSSIQADAHRTWMDLKAAFSTNKEEAVLEEAVRGEKNAVAEYDRIIKECNFPPSTENLLLKQRKGIKETLEQLSGMIQQ